ncbi:MAG: T9SS type A sorting domain-containing protein [candidate division Zixibacteria bacterium]|nr:T9SS type A sorting domain-containing protein [candidate division Zixibacteria bacterium]
MTVTTDATDLASAYVKFRKKLTESPEVWGEWDSTGTVAPQGGPGHKLFYFNNDTGVYPIPGLTPFYNGEYEAYIITIDNAGNRLDWTTAKDSCGAFVFYWNAMAVDADIISINGATHPQDPDCGYDVWRDSVNTAVVDVHGGTTDPVYILDAWVIIETVGIRDSVRIHYADTVTMPYSFDFSVTDWPKTGNGTYETTLYVRVTDTRNMAVGLDMVELCVPDVTAPDIRISYPTAYQRVPIAKSSLNSVPVQATLLSTSYDPDNPIRCEFFYVSYDMTDTVKIGEDGTYGAYFEVMWNNSSLSEGWVWLYAKVYDEVGNWSVSPWIKVWLDPDAPLMRLEVPQAVLINGGWHIAPGVNGGVVEMIAEITGAEVDVAKVEFFLAFRDSVDLAKWYNYLGTGIPAQNNSIWTFNWGPKIISGETQSLITELDTILFPMMCGTEEGDTIWCAAPCGFEYKLRIKVTDVSGNVYDDNDGDGQFDDYTFWQNPWANPIDLTTPADVSKMLFTLDCGAPQVAICEFYTDTIKFVTPSLLLGGTGVVYAKMGDMLTVYSVTLDSLNDLNAMKVGYEFWSPVTGGYVFVGESTEPDSLWKVQFDPFALGLIRSEHVMNDEYQSYIRATLTDSLGQQTTDVITCWVLDDYPGMAWWDEPEADDFVCCDVSLKLFALNGDTYKKVVYKYMLESEAANGTWTDIATVWASGSGQGYQFPATWHTLNEVPDDDYRLGFEVTDQNDNVTSADDNPQITVKLRNFVPTVSITSPEGSDTTFAERPTFLREPSHPVFKAEVSTTSGVAWVDFQYKRITQSHTAFTYFDGAADNYPPYEKQWYCPGEDSPKYGGDGEALNGAFCGDGFYHFRAVVANHADRTGYSPWIMCYNDVTAPLVRLTEIFSADAENNNDPVVSAPVGSDLTFTIAAFDTLSPNGPSDLVNSGMSALGIYVSTTTNPPAWNEIFYGSPHSSGYTTFNWATSGLAGGWYYIIAMGWDAVLNQATTEIDSFFLYDDVPPVCLVSGFYHSRIVGVSEASATVQFQYSTDNGTTWIPIGIADRVHTKNMFYNNVWTQYGIFQALWNPGDGDCLVRLVAVDVNYNQCDSPELGLTITNDTAVVTSNPTDFGPSSMQKTWEGETCDMDGLATATSSYGMPFGVLLEYNVFNDTWDWDFVEFRSIPQQGANMQYAGPFDFDVVVNNGGWGWGHVFIFDGDGTTGFSLEEHIDFYWLTENLGSGGEVCGDGDNVCVTVPPEFTNDWGGSSELLTIWEGDLAPPSVHQDVWIVPVGNANGDKMYYVGNTGCNGDLCGLDNRYATIKMAYDPSVDAPAESLRVMYYYNGTWSDTEIFFPSWVEGFDTGNHTVEFAAECLSGFFAVVKVQTSEICFDAAREWIYPWCGDTYTNGRPIFEYSFPEIFDNTLDWDYLEIRIDGKRIYTDTSWQATGKLETPTTALETADGWIVTLDEEAGKVRFFMHPWFFTVDNMWWDVNWWYTWHEWYDTTHYIAPLACGDHTVSLRIQDTQLRCYSIEDPITVDCLSPDVDFANGYVSKNPEFSFTITDDLSGVEWDSVYVDIFFITKGDTTAGGNDSPYVGKERLVFMQTFFPGQIQDYRTGNTVTISTTYELDDERAILVAIYDGTRDCSCVEGEGIDPSYYDNYDEFYKNGGGVYDCVGNQTSPHLQILGVDYDAPSVIVQPDDGSGRLIFRLTEDGSGFNTLYIYEEGTLLTGMASSPADVDAEGEFYYFTNGEAGMLYYYPTDGIHCEIHLTDKVGNVRILPLFDEPDWEKTKLEVTNYYSFPNPFHPRHEAATIKFELNEPAKVDITVYDLAGNKVTHLSSNRQMGKGDNEVTWNGSTLGGTEVATGVYLVHVKTKNGNDTDDVIIKIAVVKE